MATPYEIQSIMNQIGTRLNGGFAYTGASQFVYKAQGLSASKFDEATGCLHYGTGLMFKVNGGNRGWKMVVVLEPSDTYTVYLLAIRGINIKLLNSCSDVYCDNLQAVVESMYDEAIQKYAGGFISI